MTEEIEGSARVRELDEVDLKLMDELRKDGRTQNKVLATKLGVSESVVAYRLRRLHERGVARLTVLQDFDALGYPLLGLLQIRVRDREPRTVGNAISKLEQVIGVSLVLGEADIDTTVIARDHHDLDRLIEQIGEVAGIDRITSSVVYEVVKMRADLGSIST